MIFKIDSVAGYDKLITSNCITIILFYADWCTPFESVKRIIAELPIEFPMVSVGILDIQIHRNLADLYKVSLIPTVFIFKNGVRTYRIIGDDQKATYTSKIKELLQNSPQN